MRSDRVIPAGISALAGIFQQIFPKENGVTGWAVCSGV